MSRLANIFLMCLYVYDQHYRFSPLRGHAHFAMLLNHYLDIRLLIFLLAQLCSAAKFLHRDQDGAISFPPVVEIEAVFGFHERPEALPRPVLDSPVFPARRDPISSKNDKPTGLQVKRTLLGIRQTCRAGSKFCLGT